MRAPAITLPNSRRTAAGTHNISGRARMRPARRPCAPFAFYCRTCRKRTYDRRKRARRAARINHPGDHLRAYRCPRLPGFWHIGHLQPRGQHGNRRPHRHTIRPTANHAHSHRRGQPAPPATRPRQAA